MAIVGIDLGTTNSAVAYMKNGEPVIIENKQGGRTTPSVVQIDLKGELIFGQNAKDGIISLPDRTIIEVKRKMGTDELIKLGDKSYRPEEISALILKELKKYAEEKLGEKVTEAIITVPAYFNDTQRKATKTAGELAGLKVERIINEPTAAAISYGFDNLDSDQKLLIYDLGGGTFDVSVVELFDGILEVKASAGNNLLGGSDFDQSIVEWILQQVKAEKGVDLLELGSSDDIIRCRMRLKEEAEKIKKVLSSQTSTRINLPFIAIHDGTPISIDLEFSRHAFEMIIKELVSSTVNEIDKALQDANLTIHDIDEVILVGGSTRIPLIQEIVEKKFGKSPLRNINPDEAIALGAAVQAGIKSGEIDSSGGIIVTDVCPYTLGVEIIKEIGNQLVDGYFDPIIHRNMTIPSSRTKTYSTATANQDTVLISVYQGDNQFVKENYFLGEVELSDIPKAPAGEEAVEVTYQYDINGVLQVEAKILSTGKKVRTTISKFGSMSETQLMEAKEQLDIVWQDSELFKEVQAVIYRAEKLLATLEGNDKDRIESALDKLKQALKTNDKNQVAKYEEELTDLLIELV